MTHAEHRINGLGHAVQISRAILRAIGAWPLDERSSFVQIILHRSLNFLCYFLYLFILVPGLLRIILIEKSSHARLKMIGPLLNCFMCFLKYSFLLYKARAIRVALKEMRSDWRNVEIVEDRATMMSKATIGRRLVLLSAFFMYGGGLSYRTILPLSKGAIVTPDNLTIRSLACPGYFVTFDEQVTPFYEIVFVLQFFSGFVVYSVTCGVCGLAAFLVLHLCGQLRILIGNFRRLTADYNSNEAIVGERLALIVQHHMKIQGFLKQIEEVTRYMCLVEIVGCTTLVCLVGYYVIMEWERSDSMAMLTYFIIFLSFVFSIFIFCYIGQLLMNESTNLALTCCTIDWYRIPLQKARCLILITAMCNCSMKVTAGKMMNMSLVTFTGIMKTSMGFFNILRSTIS